MWRSTDDLKTLQQGDTVLVIPEAGKVDNGNAKEWVGLFFHRRIVEMPDGSLLAAMYGNFEQDTIVPTNPRSKSETKYKARTFVVRLFIGHQRRRRGQGLERRGCSGLRPPQRLPNDLRGGTAPAGVPVRSRSVAGAGPRPGAETVEPALRWTPRLRQPVNPLIAVR